MHALREPKARRAAAAEQARTILMIGCARSHHLARVWDTGEGLVVETNLHRHSHGRRDLHSDAHGVDRESRWFDLLSPDDDTSPADALPCGCACGDRTLSRSAVREWIAQRESRVVLD